MKRMLIHKFGKAVLSVFVVTFIATAGLVLTSGHNVLYAADTTPPTAPSNLTATAVNASRINLAWTVSTDDIGVTGYQIERCQGVGCSNFALVTTVTGRTYNNTGLQQATSYSYRVRARDAAGNLSSYSNIASATTRDATAPTAPANLTASAASESQINLAWTASTDNVGVTGYLVQRCQGTSCTNYSLLATVTGTTYNNTGLTAGTSYRYRVRARDAAGNLSSYSNVASATTLDTTPPSAPSNLGASAVSGTQINLAWNASTDNVRVTGYQVERCQGTGCSNFALVTTVTGTTYNNTGLQQATIYNYRVRARDAAGNLSVYSNTASASTLDATAPTAPTSLTASAAGENQISLTWTASTDNVGVTGYQIERCQGAGCSTFTQVTTVTGTTYNDTGLPAGTSYSYRVRSTDAAGNLSPYSGTASATTQQSSDSTPPAAPANLTATAASSQINLSWAASTDNVGVTGYQVERCQGVGCSTFTQIATTTATTYNNTGLPAGTSYSYRVRATDAANNFSAYSNTASTVTLTAVLEPSGWYAGDMHVHRSCGGSPEAISSLYNKMSANNLAFMTLLADMGNGEVQDPVTDLPRVNGQDDAVSTSGRIVHWDAEWHWDPTYNQYPHQALGGHVLALGLTEAHQIWEEYTYPIFNWAHQQNAIAGFAHMEALDGGIPQALNCCMPIEYPVEVALGSADFISEDADPAAPEYLIQAYYRLLNCGFRPGLAAGTDYPCNGGADLGSLLTYVQVAGGEMTYRNWIEGIANGRTVISRNGHNEFLNLTVNNSATPGDEIKLTGAGSVQVNIQWTANQNLSGTIELVRNGVVVASQQASASLGVPASLSTTVNFANSGWLAARRMGSNGQVVHTAAVFVTVNDAPVRASAADADFYVQWMDNLLTKTSPGGAWNSYFPTDLAAAQARYTAAKALYQQIKSEASTLLMITTQSLPDGALNVSYSTTLAASGGTSPYTWSIASGSLPTGLTLNAATGVISGTPTTIGTFSFTVQVTDSSNPAKTTTAALNITIITEANYSLWPGTTVPGLVDGGPDSSVELGMKFRADLNGYITGIRFYKASTNTGTHVANLWSSSGTPLATATFTGETASGWQQVLFSSPVAITANTVYVASYHASNGHYSADVNYFASNGVDNPPLHALANGVSGGNGVFAYGSTSSFPNQTWNAANYWVDVVFSAAPPATLSSIAVAPASQTISTGATQQYTATGTYSDGSTQNLTSQVTWASSNTGVATITSAGLATGVSPGSTTISATMSSVTGGTNLTVQAAPLTITTTFLPGGTLTVSYSAMLVASGGTMPYTWSIASGSLPTGLSINSSTGVISGTPTAAGSYSFNISVTDASNPAQTTTKAFSIVIDLNAPILIITSASNPFSTYYAEILRTEGFNEFTMNDMSGMTSTVLAPYDVVILGEMALTSDQVTMLSDWVNAGGHLITMRPDKKLAGLLGLTDLSSTISDAYLLVNTSSSPGVGIVGETIQYHGTADKYSLNGASSLATLYSNATTTTSNPAVTLRSVGTNGGQAVAFTYDLARSIVYTRQGNPAWAGQNRDVDVSPVGDTLIRSDDLFYPDWVDLNKVAIPQADEQQRLLANLIIQMNFNKKPLPRFGYLPRNLPAAVVMTGDDHDGNGTAGRFNDQMAMNPSCSVENWECIRSTSYIYPTNAMTNFQAKAYVDEGFEVALHTTTNCADWTPSSLESFFSNQLSSWSAKYTSLLSPVTNRVHCIPWSDYATMPAVELNHGIRFDENYYYWPPGWVNDRPGFFTGSGMPMRFTDANGNLIDVYQATTQLTDESGQTYPYTIDTLLDRATGPEGYYGVFTVNAHTDLVSTLTSTSVVNSALAHGVPVVSARQMLTWLDGRNASTCSSLNWNGNTLSFSIIVGQGANGLVIMAPVPTGQTVTNVAANGSSIPFTMNVVKGVQYARFLAANGAYQVSYTIDATPPVVSAATPTSGSTGVSTATNVTVTFSEAMDPATISTNSIELRDASNALVPATVTSNAATWTATLAPTNPLANSVTYTATIKGETNGVKDLAGNPMTNDFTWSFTTAASAGPYTIWPSTAVPANPADPETGSGEVGVKFRSDVNGYITGIRFYKASTNTGTHIGSLWTNTGTLLARATFTNETASGWQQVTFSTPVAIIANTVYVASYHMNVGHYSDDPDYFAGKGVDNPPLHALADGVSGENGVGAAGSTSTFPTMGWRSSNYWVDVVFQP